MMNGGFATTSPNRSPRTGSYRSPCRQSTLPTSFSAALSRARRSARGFRSTPTTRLAVASGEEGLDARAGAEVEARLHLPAHRQPGEHSRRRPDLDDVVAPGLSRRPVGREHEALERLQGEARPHEAVSDRDQSGAAQLGQIEVAECRGRGRGRDGLAREEEADERRERLVGVRPEPERREPVLEAEAAVVADEPVDALLVEADTLQALAEVRDYLERASASRF